MNKPAARSPRRSLWLASLAAAATFLPLATPFARTATATVAATPPAWDPGRTRTEPGSGGDGTWDLTTANWLLPNGADGAYPNGSSAAVFEGAAGTVNLNVSGVSSGAVSFYTAGYVLQDAPGTSYALTLSNLYNFSSGTVTVSLPVNLTGSTSSLGAEAGNTLALTGTLTTSGPLNVYNVGGGGGGTVILSGSNAVSGTTTIYGGTLQLAGAATGVASGVQRPSGAHPLTTAAPAQVLGGTTGVVINPGGTLLYGASNQLAAATPVTLGGGTFNLGTFSQSRANALGALTLAGNSAIDFGAGVSTGGTLALADSSQIAWSGQLSIYDFQGTPLVGGGKDQLFFGTSASGLTAAQLAEITFYAGGAGSAALGTGVLLADGEVTYTPNAVPEPSTWAAVLAGTGFLSLVLRRRARG